MDGQVRSGVLRYGSSAVVVLLAFALRMLLDSYLDERFSAIILLTPILLIAWSGGLGPAIFSIVAAVLLAVFFIIEPRRTFWVHSAEDQLAFLLYAVAGVVIVLFARGWRNATRRTEASESQYRRLAETLQEKEERLRLAMEASAVGWWEWDLVHDVVDADAQTKALFGLPPEAEASFEKFLASLAPGQVDSILEEMPLAMATHGDFDREFHLIWPDGSSHWILGRGRVFRDQQGMPQRLRGLVMDISACKEAQRTAAAEQRTAQLRALAAELTRAEQRERRRLAKILHDHLQQLLVAARMRLSGLQRHTENERTAATLEQIHELLDQCLTESRSLTLELSPPVLYEAGLTAGLQWLARQMEEKHHLRVEVEADPAAEPASETRRVFLFEAVREMLLNVVKHAQTDYARVTLRSLDAERLELVVADSGQGFELARIEERQESNGGFGLFSIRERLEVLGGHLQIDTAPGRGTRMVIEVPRTDAVMRPSEAATELVATLPFALPGVRPEEPQALGRPKKTRVLLADDHAIVRQGLAGMLREHEEIDVVGEAADGQEAVAAAMAIRPDVVLMDITMPRLNGIEATRYIVDTLPEVRVIGLSMHDEADMAAAMRQAGAVAYFCKDVASDTLLSTILPSQSS